jgi:hypothetical protein
MKLRHITLLLGLFLLAQTVQAQYLVLRKKGSKRKYEYTVGSTFVYKQKGFDVYFKDKIVDFADSTIIMENNLLALDQIEIVDIQNSYSNRPEILMLGENYLPWIGVGLFAIDFINYTLVDGNSYSLDRGVTTTSAVLVGTGLALKFMRRKKVNLTKPKFEAYIVGL